MQLLWSQIWILGPKIYKFGAKNFKYLEICPKDLKDLEFCPKDLKDLDEERIRIQTKIQDLDCFFYDLDYTAKDPDLDRKDLSWPQRSEGPKRAKKQRFNFFPFLKKKVAGRSHFGWETFTTDVIRD